MTYKYFSLKQIYQLVEKYHSETPFTNILFYAGRIAVLEGMGETTKRCVDRAFEFARQLSSLDEEFLVGSQIITYSGLLSEQGATIVELGEPGTNLALVRLHHGENDFSMSKKDQESMSNRWEYVIEDDAHYMEVILRHNMRENYSESYSYIPENIENVILD